MISEKTPITRASELSGQPAKRVAVIQSCYIPWKGFFDLIGRCHEYVVFDRAQYVKRHWHNRNKIKTPRGAEWLTIPVMSKSRFNQPIDEVEISEPWAEKHWRALELNYARAPHFDEQRDRVRAWYEAADRLKRLSEVNLLFLSKLAKAFSLTVRIVSDSEYPAEDLRQTMRLVRICELAGATHYLSGPSARAYLEERRFEATGIAVEWMTYGPYPEYRQLHGSFEHAVTALDVLFNLGPDAPRAIQVTAGASA